jgi:pimeloyl-ACP methyl ester carboxylesterase
MKLRLMYIVLLLLAILTSLIIFYLVDTHKAKARVAQGSEMVRSAGGNIEYARGGDGPEVFVIHGSGGGFDQGALIAGAVLPSGWSWIAPSRFGYLRSNIPDKASFAKQADAYARLMDSLGLTKVHVMAMSHGGPSALLFAANYPEHVSSLILLSCGVTALASDDQADANRKGDALTRIFRSDLAYWTVSTFMKQMLMTLMGADRAIFKELNPDQRQLVNQVIAWMKPVTLRADGVTFDNQAVMPGKEIAAIQAPTLIFHARDDRLQLFEHAGFAAKHIPQAEMVDFERGGHMLLIVEQEAVRSHIKAFLQEVEGL